MIQTPMPQIAKAMFVQLHVWYRAHPVKLHFFYSSFPCRFSLNNTLQHWYKLSAPSVCTPTEAIVNWHIDSQMQTFKFTPSRRMCQFSPSFGQRAREGEGPAPHSQNFWQINFTTRRPLQHLTTDERAVHCRPYYNYTFSLHLTKP